MIKLDQNSSGAHRAQGTNWLGVDLVGCRVLGMVYSKVRNLGCTEVVEILDKFQNLVLVQLIQERRAF